MKDTMKDATPADWKELREAQEHAWAAGRLAYRYAGPPEVTAAQVPSAFDSHAPDYIRAYQAGYRMGHFSR